jgi:hypothetical protein
MRPPKEVAKYLKRQRILQRRRSGNVLTLN